jgi:hypothetical protein
MLEEMTQTLFIDGDWTNVRDYFDIDNYVQYERLIVVATPNDQPLLNEAEIPILLWVFDLDR